MPRCSHGTFNHYLRDYSPSEGSTAHRLEMRHREKTGCTALVFAHKRSGDFFGKLCCEKHGVLSSWL